jgi:hypothetical protein
VGRIALLVVLAGCSVDLDRLHGIGVDGSALDSAPELSDADQADAGPSGAADSVPYEPPDMSQDARGLDVGSSDGPADPGDALSPTADAAPSLRPLGDACLNGSQCSSGNCATVAGGGRVCCDRPCGSDSCSTCSASGKCKFAPERSSCGPRSCNNHYVSGMLSGPATVSFRICQSGTCVEHKYDCAGNVCTSNGVGFGRADGCDPGAAGYCFISPQPGSVAPCPGGTACLEEKRTCGSP